MTPPSMKAAATCLPTSGLKTPRNIWPNRSLPPDFTDCAGRPTQAQAAELLGIRQPKVSDPLRGRSMAFPPIGCFVSLPGWVRRQIKLSKASTHTGPYGNNGRLIHWPEGMKQWATSKRYHESRDVSKGTRPYLLRCLPGCRVGRSIPIKLEPTISTSDRDHGSVVDRGPRATAKQKTRR